MGTLLSVPRSAAYWVARENYLRGNNVNLVHLTQTANGDLNSQIATISIQQRNQAPARMAWLPYSYLRWIQRINFNTTIIEQTAIGDGNTQVAQVEILQSSPSVSTGTRFLMSPLWALAALRAYNRQNFNVVHIIQTVVGNGNSQVATVAIDQSSASRLQVPRQVLPYIQRLNVNVTVVRQTAIGNGNTQVVTVNVT
jgi:hypothetical protein